MGYEHYAWLLRYQCQSHQWIVLVEYMVAAKDVPVRKCVVLLV